MKLHFEHHKLCNVYSVKLGPIIASLQKRYNKDSNHGMSLSQTRKPAFAGRTSKACGSELHLAAIVEAQAILIRCLHWSKAQSREPECLGLEPLKNCTLCSLLWSEGFVGRKATQIEYSWVILACYCSLKETHQVLRESAPQKKLMPYQELHMN